MILPNTNSFPWLIVHRTICPSMFCCIRNSKCLQWVIRLSLSQACCGQHEVVVVVINIDRMPHLSPVRREYKWIWIHTRPLITCDSACSEWIFFKLIYSLKSLPSTTNKNQKHPPNLVNAFPKSLSNRRHCAKVVSICGLSVSRSVSRVFVHYFEQTIWKILIGVWKKRQEEEFSLFFSVLWRRLCV